MQGLEMYTHKQILHIMVGSIWMKFWILFKTGQKTCRFFTNAFSPELKNTPTGARISPMHKAPCKLYSSALLWILFTMQSQSTYFRADSSYFWRSESSSRYKNRALGQNNTEQFALRTPCHIKSLSFINEYKTIGGLKIFRIQYRGSGVPS